MAEPKTLPKLMHRTRHDKIDLSNLPQAVKDMLLTQSEASKSTYTPDKVVTRSDNRFSCIEAKQYIFSRNVRKQEVLKSGFCSDPKELYKPLGTTN